MGREPIVISFYTLDTPYEQEVRKLIESCVEWDIDADIVGIPSRGSWEKNCGMKPEFILQKLRQWERPVLWVDADAVFLQRPDFQELMNYEFSVRVNEFLPKTHESYIVSNTIFINDHPRTLELMELWVKKNQKALEQKDRVLEFWDQVALRDVLENENLHGVPLRFLPMPLKFCKIFDLDNLFISEEEVVIEHYQASRRLKNKIHENPLSSFTQDHCCH